MKLSKEKRFLLFNTVCIPFRIGILLIIFFFPLPELAVLTGLISLGFLYKYFYPTKKGFFGGKVFWSRLYHFLTYLLATIFLLVEDVREYAFWFLAADIIISFMLYYYFRSKAIII